MSKYFKETKENLKRYYTSGEFSIAAEILGSEGFMANIYTPERAFYIVTRIMEDAETVIMEIAPEIHCTSEETINMTSEYANKVNEIHVTGNVKISENGRLYIQLERKFDNAPLTLDVFKRMEASAISIANTFADTLQKLANAKLLSASESEPSKVVAKHIAQMEENVSLIDKLRAKRRKSMDSHENRERILALLEDDDEEIEMENMEPSFGEFLKILDEFSNEKNNNEEEKDDNISGKMNLLDRLRKADMSSCEEVDDFKNDEVDPTDEEESDE